MLLRNTDNRHEMIICPLYLCKKLYNNSDEYVNSIQINHDINQLRLDISYLRVLFHYDVNNHPYLNLCDNNSEADYYRMMKLFLVVFLALKVPYALSVLILNPAMAGI